MVRDLLRIEEVLIGFARDSRLSTGKPLVDTTTQAASRQSGKDSLTLTLDKISIVLKFLSSIEAC